MLLHHAHTRHQWHFFVIVLVFYGRRCWETMKEKKIKKRASITISVNCSNCARHAFKQKFVWRFCVSDSSPTCGTPGVLSGLRAVLPGYCHMVHVRPKHGWRGVHRERSDSWDHCSSQSLQAQLAAVRLSWITAEDRRLAPPKTPRNLLFHQYPQRAGFKDSVLS